MAATSVAATVARVTAQGGAGDGFAGTGINATTLAFALQGGWYGVSCIGSTFGTVTLQKLGPDQTTWLTAPGHTAFAVNGEQMLQLPPGQYRLALA